MPDYLRIYREHIADRRANPPGPDETVDRHHIIPVCMGGTNDPENIIRLRPEDHFFAHLLLAKGYGTSNLWGAVLIMLGKRNFVTRRGVSWRWQRKRYGWLAARRPRGDATHNADLAERTFYHLDGQTFTGTRLGLRDFIRNPSQRASHNISRMVNGRPRGRRYATAYGWSLRRITAEDRRYQINHFDPVERTYYHVEGETFTGTRIGLAMKIGLPRGQGSSTINLMVTGKIRTAFGWALRPITLEEYVLNVGKTDLVKRTFYHLDGATFTGTRMDLGQLIGMPPEKSANIDQMVRGETATAYGWSLIGMTRVEYRMMRREAASLAGAQLRGFVRDKAIHHFFHEERGLSVLATQIGMKRYYGLDRSATSALVLGGSHVRAGWCMADKAEGAYDRSLRRGANNANYDPTEHAWYDTIHDRYETATIWAMGRDFADGDSRGFGAVAAGAKRGYLGWKLASDTDPTPLRVLGLRHRFIHKTKGVAVGTPQELAAFMKCSPMVISRCVTGERVRGMGWVYDGLADTPMGQHGDVDLSKLAYGEHHRLLHPRKGRMEGSLRELAGRIDCNPAEVSRLSLGYRKSLGGWLYDGLASDPPRHTGMVPLYQSPQGKTHRLWHPLRGRVEGTQAELARKTGLDFRKVSLLVAGTRAKSGGWSLDKSVGEPDTQSPRDRHPVLP